MVFKVFLPLLVLGVLSVSGRPEIGTNKNAEFLREGKAQAMTSQIDSANLPMEGRVDEEIGGVKKLSYYGGALGRFLLVDPSGKMRIVGKTRPPPGPREEEEEEDVGIADEGPGGDDTVAIDHPPANASIAEAKPIAVSIAGVGGLASAQPVATAVVGPGGLALTKPVATAISGIKGSEGLLSVIGGDKGPPSPYLYTLLPHHQPSIIYYPIRLY